VILILPSWALATHAETAIVKTFATANPLKGVPKMIQVKSPVNRACAVSTVVLWVMG
jgi:hypothetical protein